jgi:hypothetical protein
VSSHMVRGPFYLLPAALECERVKIVLEYPVASFQTNVAVQAKASFLLVTSDLVTTGKTPQ